MKLSLRFFLYLCFLLQSGGGLQHACTQQGARSELTGERGSFSEESLTRQEPQAFFLSSQHGAPNTTRVVAIADDVEDRDEEEDESSPEEEAAGIGHAALCARPRAPGGDGLPLVGKDSAFRKHFAWSLQERHIVLRVFRV